MSTTLPLPRWTRAAALLLAWGLCVAEAGADDHDSGAEQERPTLQEPFPFDHAVHEEALRSARITCTDCHPVGLAEVSGDAPVAPGVELPPPRGSCHGCHLAELDRSPRAAPSTCASCHADLTELTPDDHVPGWLRAHAPEARAGAGSCRDCHETSWCFACHDDRGPVSENPHEPGFRVVHGVEARLDPRSCTTCHTGQTCVECHESGGAPW